jgi:hypothetical protein
MLVLALGWPRVTPLDQSRLDHLVWLFLLWNLLKLGLWLGHLLLRGISLENLL